MASQPKYIRNIIQDIFKIIENRTLIMFPQYVYIIDKGYNPAIAIVCFNLMFIVVPFTQCLALLPVLLS